MNEMALCPTRAKIAAALLEPKRVTVQWKPTESGMMLADVAPYGKGKMVTWPVAVTLVKSDNRRPATGRDAAATVLIAVALDATGRWQAKLSPGQDEGERPLVLDGAEGGYPAAQAAVAGAMADYAKAVVGKRRGYIPTALRSPLGGVDLVQLGASS